MIIAIDGPAGSGKSTTARAVAARLGYLYLDTGAMYRTVALALQRAGVTDDPIGITDMLGTIQIELTASRRGTKVHLSGVDVSDDIRSPDVTRLASRISAHREVRAFLVDEQRRIVARELDGSGGVVVEGRDIGTVVFPEARLKLFLTADSHERARRRTAEIRDRGEPVEEEQVRRELDDRDHHDSSRAVSPLRMAEDAIVLDTTDLSFDDQVDRIVSLARERAD